MLAWMLSVAVRGLALVIVRGVVPSALVVVAAALLPWWPLQALVVIAAVSMLTFLTFTPLLLARDMSEDEDEDLFLPARS